MTAELTLTADRRFEFAYGKTLPEKEEWMATEYFPAAGPSFMKYGCERLAGFGIMATNVRDVSPVQGAFTSWPTAKHRADLLVDPGFAPLLPVRDAAMDHLSDGHLFQPIDEVIALNTDSDYAIVLSADANAAGEPIVSLPLADDSPDQTYAGKSISILPWGDRAEALLGGAPENAEVFRVRFG